jgi:hypothetical protein
MVTKTVSGAVEACSEPGELSDLTVVEKVSDVTVRKFDAAKKFRIRSERTNRQLEFLQWRGV